MAEISIIIRTKNEERWIGHCLWTILQQDFKDFEIILVDNDSSDHTVDVAKRYPITRHINIEKFKPGLAINEGIRASTGRYLVCLSAHCIPQKRNWLSQLKATLEEDSNYAGVYGRQLPLSFTDPIDKRDLLIVFGQDKRVQEKDYFFHNANSIFRRDVWEKFPFDEEVTNIEDRVWGKAVTEAGYKIAYDPEAAVYHYHGLHQGNSPKRAKGVVSIIERVDQNIFGELPETMRPENIRVAAVIPVMDDPNLNSREFSLIKKSVADIKQSTLVKDIFIVANSAAIAEAAGAGWIDRKTIVSAESLSLDQVMQESLSMIETTGIFPDSLLYVNYDYMHRPAGIFDELIRDAQFKGCDTIFPGLTDYGHYWIRNADDDYVQTDGSLKSRADREPQYKAIYGLGCLTASWVIRSGRLIGGKIGILKISDVKSAFRFKELGDQITFGEK